MGCKESYVVPTLTNHEFYGIFYSDSKFDKKERVAALLAFIGVQFCFTALAISEINKPKIEFCELYILKGYDPFFITDCVTSPKNAIYFDHDEYCLTHEAEGIFKCCGEDYDEGCDKIADGLCSCAGKIAVPLVMSILISIAYTIISFPFLSILKRHSKSYNWIGYFLIVGVLAVVGYILFLGNTRKELIIACSLQVVMSLFIISPIVGTILTCIKKCLCPGCDGEDER